MSVSSNETVKLADVIQPKLFTQYVMDETTEKSAIMFAGVIENNPLLNTLVAGGGTTITMPKWNDLSGESQVLTEDDPIYTDKLTSKSEVATMLIRAKGWSSHELAGALSATDPMKAIVSRVSDWWVRDEKKQVMSILNGVFGADSMSPLVHTVNGALDANVVLDAKQRLGDASDLLTLIYMNSATFTKLQKDNVIQFIPVAESKISIPTYLGYRVVVDDTAPVIAGEKTKYVSYLLSAGCIQRGTGIPSTLTPTETDRDSAMSTDYLYNRQAKVLHPKGISWIGAGNIVGPTPSNTELATGTNWRLISDVKKIGMVKIEHTL